MSNEIIIGVVGAVVSAAFAFALKIVFRALADMRTSLQYEQQVANDFRASAEARAVKLVQSENRIAQLETANARLDGVVGILQIANTELRAAVELAAREFNTYKTDKGAIIDALMREAAERKQELAAARKEIADMQTNIDHVASALESAQLRIKELETRENELRISLAEAREEISRLKLEANVKDIELAALKKRFGELEDELKRVQAERVRLEGENKKLEARLRQAGTEPGESATPQYPETKPEPKEE